ncbi:MAG: type II secretion system F family protein [Acidobacteriota bacterium]
MQMRLGAIQESAFQSSPNPEVVLLRDAVLNQIPIFSRLLMKIPITGKLQLYIEQSALKITVETLLMIAMAVAVIVFLLVSFIASLPMLVGLALALLSGAIPFAVVAFYRQRRFSKFEELFPDAIDMLARAVRAGHAFTTSFELIAREMPEPLAGEFKITFEQQNLGMPLKEALHNLTVRMPLTDVFFFTSALQIQRESGGNLAEILDNLSHVIRERFKILRQVRVVTAQGRMTLYLLMALTPGFTFLMYLRNPKYVGRLFTDPLGQKALAVGVILQIIGFLIIRKIIRIKV